jgi:lipopolysaccharide biosynthesis glycosyltransferase
MNNRPTQKIDIHGLVLSDLQRRGLYTRPTERRDGRVYDILSQRPDYDGAMSTEFANSRFLVPFLAERGMALFMDCDMLVRSSLMELFQRCEAERGDFAVWCVKHDYRPKNEVKMDGQKQTIYSRKNWSSVVLWDVDHPSNKKLTIEAVNTLPGKDLHAFCWLEDREIGELPAEFNFLVGHTDPSIDPKIVHFTEGFPGMKGYENVPFAEDWRNELEAWAV